MSKVETEVLRFQREIEKSANERSRIQDWERRRKSSRSHNCSMDSLLSLDSDASSTYNLNLRTPIKGGTAFKMPPKGKFSSTTSLLTNVQKQILLKNEESKWGSNNHRFSSSSPSPPTLPPKSSNLASTHATPLKPSKESSHGDKKDTKNSPKNNVSKRRVSISTDAVQIIGQSDSEEAYDYLKANTTTTDNNLRNMDTDAVPIKQLPVNDEKKLFELKNGKKIHGRMSVPDVVPSHELTTDVCMRTQTKEMEKQMVTQNLNQPKGKIMKGKTLFANNKDLEDLTERGLPSVKDLVNRFMPNRTGMVKIKQSPEPKPRQSLLQKVIKFLIDKI